MFSFVFFGPSEFCFEAKSKWLSIQFSFASVRFTITTIKQDLKSVVVENYVLEYRGKSEVTAVP